MILWLLPLLSLAAPDDFLDRIKSSQSDGLVVLRDGKLISSYKPTRRVHIQSITKTFTSLATGLLLKQGKLTSIDTPLSSLLPELAQDPKGPITLRQLLSHSSGMRDARTPDNQNLDEYKLNDDYLTYTLRLPMEAPPGTKFHYSNAGIMLLSAALERAAGEPLHLYLNRQLFAPLGIKSARWWLDKKQRCPFFFGLTINAEDLAKIGQLILDGGRDFFPPDWIAQSTSVPGNPATSNYTSLVWRFEPSSIPGQPLVIQHPGDGGNSLAIFPRNKVVVVRLRQYQPKPDTMKDFLKLAYKTFAEN